MMNRSEMIKNLLSICRYFVRHRSEVKFEEIPKNKYNSKRSAFNFNPVVSDGLILCPPSSLTGPKIRTPRAFIMDLDPRKNGIYFKEYTTEQLKDYPVLEEIIPLDGSKKEISAETVREIQTLRSADAQKWTISRLASEFKLHRLVVNDLTSPRAEGKEGKEGKEAKEGKDKVSEIEYPFVVSRKKKSVLDRKKRTLMWLRNEF